MEQSKDKANPAYITQEIEERIAEMIEKGAIHPYHPACDFTVEVAAGADLKRAIRNWVRRDNTGRTYSVYKKKN